LSGKRMGNPFGPALTATPGEKSLLPGLGGTLNTTMRFGGKLGLEAAGGNPKKADLSRKAGRELTWPVVCPGLRGLEHGGQKRLFLA